jgi:hypothetical protein
MRARRLSDYVSPVPSGRKREARQAPGRCAADREAALKLTAAQRTLLFQLRVLPVAGRVEAEFFFHPERRWRFDVALVDWRVGVEIDGGGFVGGNDPTDAGAGRHSRGLGMEGDNEKGAEALLHGWWVFHGSPAQVRAGTVLRWLERAVAARRESLVAIGAAAAAGDHTHAGGGASGSMGLLWGRRRFDRDPLVELGRVRPRGGRG